MKAEEKTNVMRVLEQKKVPYKGHCYVDTDAVSGVEVAEVLGQDPAHVFKTLVTMGKTKQNYVFVIPVARELDLKKAAKADVYKRQVKAKRHWRDSSLSGSGKNRVFRHCGDHREDSII